MTLDEALELAARVEVCKACAQRGASALARFVLDTLGTQMPCGFDKPGITPSKPGSIDLVIEWDGSTYTREEALGLAAALVRCALELPKGE